MDISELAYVLALKFTSGLGNKRIGNLCKHFGSAEQAFHAPLSALREVEGLDQRSITAIGQQKNLERAKEELERVRKVGASITCYTDAHYPEALKALHDPPVVLWYKGDLPKLEVVPKAVGIVGTRNCSQWALGFTRSLAKDLAGVGVMVISGLAKGIDTAAHQAALDVGGMTIGVMGSGVDTIYPAENKRMAERMVVVSEYPIGSRPAAHHFPERNRIIAALSAGTVVVEGNIGSGALITAVAALECGRSVFAVPGRAGDPLAAGCHKLLREGAVLTESAADVFAELGWAAHLKPAPELPETQAKIYKALETPQTLDYIALLTGLDAGTVQVELMMMTLSGVVFESGGGRYARS